MDDPEKNAAALKELLKEDANKHCADCGQLGTRWASWNIGVFLCIRCGGLHRTLGTHISKIKSCTLDKWTDEQVQGMRRLGNARVNAELNPFPERFPFPSLTADQQQYIKDKYERRLFSATNAVKSPIIMTGKPLHHFGEKTYSTEIRSMREMGFMDAQACLAALKKTNGNVNAAVDLLFAKEEAGEEKKLPVQPLKSDNQVNSNTAIIEDDPWSRIDTTNDGDGDDKVGRKLVTEDSSNNTNTGVSPPPYLEDPFADWK